MTETAATVFVVLAGAVALAFLVLSFDGYDHGAIAKRCLAHNGVQQIAHSWAWKDKTMVVCRDGSVWAP